VDVHGDDALLPNAPREAEIVAETWGGAEVLCGRDATLTTVSSALPDAVMVHFACHGVTYAERPGGYYLALAGDDVLTVAEIASLRSEKFGLAVLSACNTALTKGHSERVSLATAFIAAGFAEVVASIAPVADQHAVRFSELFHHHIQQANAEPGNGRRADQALAKALMTLRDEYPEEPYAWAIWVHTGATV
jgi:CHAT domain-containing protein